MFKRTQNRRTLAMVLALGLLTACGDVSGVGVTIDRGNWPWPWASGTDFFDTRTVSENVPVEEQKRIRLEGVNGQVAITAERGASSVRMSASLRVGSSESTQDAEEGMNQLEIRVTNRSDEVLVQTLQPNDPGGRQYVVDYTIIVPSHLVIDVHQSNGHVSAEGIENSLFVDVLNGTVEATVTWPFTGEIRLSAINGDFDLRIPTDMSAQLSAFVDTGTITVDNLDVVDAVRTDQTLKGTLGDGAGLIDLETMNGRIELAGFDG
jgi:hypothetical protein